jgi:3-hydroxy-9,10-secoandrosta-1,3,5(10)-triene-9,17-dione monooxygenase
LIRGKAVASNHLRDEPLYRLALVPFFATNLVFPVLGIAKAAPELFLEKARHRGIAYTWYEKQDEAAITHLQAGEAWRYKCQHQHGAFRPHSM